MTVPRSPVLRFPVLALALVAAAGCGGKSDPVPRKESGNVLPAKQAGDSKAPGEAEPADNAMPKLETPAESKVAEPATDQAKVDAADPLGRRFADPPWFRKDMLAGAKSMDVARSARTAEGLFSSQMLFEMPAGTTAEQCAEQVEAKVGTEVTNLARGADEKDAGRIKITGSTDRYRVTMMCGEAKGVMRAYVSFEWLK